MSIHLFFFLSFGLLQQCLSDNFCILAWIEIFHKTVVHDPRCAKVTVNTCLFVRLLELCPKAILRGSEWEWDWLLNVTCNDISVIYRNYVTAHRCAGGLKKKLGLRSGSQRHRPFVGLFNMPVQAPTRGQTFYGYSEKPPRFSRLLRHAWGYGGRTHFRLSPRVSTGEHLLGGGGVYSITPDRRLVEVITHCIAPSEIKKLAWL